MGSRPRLGSEGRVVLPSSVTVLRPDGPGLPGDVVSTFDFSGRYRVGEAGGSVRLTDPFERRADGLLLTESFARLDLRRPRKARAWFLANGVPDLEWFDRERDLEHAPTRRPGSRDEGRSIATEQDLIRHYLTIIERITRTLPPPAGAGAAWDPGPFPVIEQVFGGEDTAPMARVLFDVTMDSIAGYLARSMQPEIDPLGVRPRTGRPSFPGAAGVSVGPDIRYEWRSIIAPIYLQLYEALRRLSEGRPGARTCVECGDVFLVLDGRREKYCTSAEFARNRQRRYRERRAARASWHEARQARDAVESDQRVRHAL